MPLTKHPLMVISTIMCDELSNDLKGIVGIPWFHPWASEEVGFTQRDVFKKLAQNGIIAKPITMEGVNPTTKLFEPVYVVEIASDKFEINPKKMSASLRRDVGDTVVLALLDYFKCQVQNIAKLSQIEITTYVDSSQSVPMPPTVTIAKIKDQKLQ